MQLFTVSSNLVAMSVFLKRTANCSSTPDCSAWFMVAQQKDLPVLFIGLNSKSAEMAWFSTSLKICSRRITNRYVPFPGW